MPLNIADDVTAPLDLGSNDYGNKKFTVTTSSVASALPDAMQGRFVQLLSTVDCEVGFSRSSSATVNVNATALAAGESTNVGGFLQANVPRTFRLPGQTPDEGENPADLYIVRQGTGTGTLRVEVTSGAE